MQEEKCKVCDKVLHSDDETLCVECKLEKKYFSDPL